MPNKTNQRKILSAAEKRAIMHSVDTLRQSQGMSVAKAMKEVAQRTEQCYYNWRKEFASKKRKPAAAAPIIGQAPGIFPGPLRFERVFDAQGNDFLLIRRPEGVEFVPAKTVLDLFASAS